MLQTKFDEQEESELNFGRFPVQRLSLKHYHLHLERLELSRNERLVKRSV